MKLRKAAINLSLIAHIWAWGTLLILLLWPAFYRGTSTIPVEPAGPDGWPPRYGPSGPPGEMEIARDASSIVEANGWWVLAPLLVPVALTALGIVVSYTWDGRRLTNKLLMWGLVVSLIIFSGLSMYYLSIFYVLEPLLLLASAIAVSLKSSPATRAGA